MCHGFRKRHFASHPDMSGKILRLNRHPFTIVGVTPPWFHGLDVDTPYDVAIPIGCEPILHTDRSALAARSWWWLRILGRLPPGETPQQAQAKMKALAPEVDPRHASRELGCRRPAAIPATVFFLHSAATGFSRTGQQYRTALFTLMAVVGLVLLIASANIANLLARAAARQREISIRLAIGAAAGLIFAVWGSRLLVRFLSKAGGEIQLDTAPDLHVLAFTAGWPC